MSTKNDIPWTELVEEACKHDLQIEGDFGAYSPPDRELLERTNLLRKFTEEAIDRARLENLSPNSDEASALIDAARAAADQVIEVIDNYVSRQTYLKRHNNEDDLEFLQRVLQADRVRPNLAARTNPDSVTGLNSWPEIDDLDKMAERYLSSGWRNPTADRLIIRLLIEYPTAELLLSLTKKGGSGSFGLGENFIAVRDDGRSHLEWASRPRFWLRFLGMVMAPFLLPLLVVLAAMLYVYSPEELLINELLTPALLVWSLITTLAIAVILSIIFAAVGLKHRSIIRSMAKDIIEMVIDLDRTLKFTEGDGPLSLSELRREAQRLRDRDDVVLPQMLFSMIDTLENEGKTHV